MAKRIMCGRERKGYSYFSSSGCSEIDAGDVSCVDGGDAVQQLATFPSATGSVSRPTS